MPVLYERYPRLASALARCELTTLPTPVDHLDNLGRHLNRSNLYIKRDDLTAAPYGGNKIRKLEFLLADARNKGAVRIITSGAAGSNHALATAIYSRQCGFACTLMLFAQPPAPGIDRQLLADFSTGAEVLHDETYPDHCHHLSSTITHYTQREGIPPYVIPAGGSSAVGVIGYVNAGFELAEQIEQKKLPAPATIHVTLGTMGTAVGLLLGLSIAGINSKIVAVRVVPDFVADRVKCATLFEQCNALLHKADPGFPLISFEQTRFRIENNQFGNGYGIPTPQALAAITTFRNCCAIALDPVYTGKTAAAFIDDVTREPSRETPALFWHTKSVHAAPIPDNPPDYHAFPPEFQRYFLR